MQQSSVYDLLKMLEVAIEDGFPVITKRHVIIKTNEIIEIIDRIYQSLPLEVQEARKFLRMKEELQSQAQAKADRIIEEAQREADRKLSEADYIKALEREGNRIKAQVQEDCEAIKRKAFEEAESIRKQTFEDAMHTKEGVELFCEQILNNVEGNLAQLQKLVKDGQVALEEKKNKEVANSYNSSPYATSEK